MISIEPMPESPRYWICMLSTLVIVLLLAIYIFRRRLQNYLIKLNNWSIKRGSVEVMDGSSMPRVGVVKRTLRSGPSEGRPNAPSEPGMGEVDVEKEVSMNINDATVTYRPGPRLEADNCHKKYDELCQNYLMREFMEHGVDSKANKTDNEHSKLLANRTMVMGNPKHDVSVKADLNTASPRTSTTNVMTESGLYSSVYPSLKAELQNLNA